MLWSAKEKKPILFFIDFWVEGTLTNADGFALIVTALCCLSPVLTEVLSPRSGSYLQRHLVLYFMILKISNLDHTHLQDLDVIRKHSKGSVCRHPWSSWLPFLLEQPELGSLTICYLLFLFAVARRLLPLGISSCLSWRILPFLSLWAVPSSPAFCLTQTQSSWMFFPNNRKKTKWPILAHPNKNQEKSIMTQSSAS